MSPLDWLVLLATLAAIVAYGTLRDRVSTMDGYLRAGADLRYWTIGLSIMATQASAITFLSVPGQAYQDGMGFVQFYFGLPIAMVILAAFIVPIYQRLKLYTAYEYLETRFDRKTRQLVAALFLLQRGLSIGLSIYAPAIVLSSVLGWRVVTTNLALGAVTIVYTVVGGSRAVARTQTLQMTVILCGMAAALGYAIFLLPTDVSFGHAVSLAGTLGKLEIVDPSPRLDTRYTLWSGLLGGFFVALAYFGTDQSQVQRYLAGGPLTESRLGLLMHGFVKIPMQLFVLFVGVMVFVFYQLNPPPVFFNRAELDRVRAVAPQQVAQLESEQAQIFAEKRLAITQLMAAESLHDQAALVGARAEVRADEHKLTELRARTRRMIARVRPGVDTKDADYIFVRFVLDHFPHGLIGLLVAVILCAAMSSSAAALSALGTTTVIDFYRLSVRPGRSDAHYLLAARVFTAFWGAFAVSFAGFAALLDNLIQAVNILGSLFYGPTLGVFLLGFFSRRVGGTAAFAATLAGQAIVLMVFGFSSISFLWYNVIGCVAVIALSQLVERVRPSAAA
ncbi:MAG TPA: sodium:solute symporter [Polyangiales bacterium]